MKKLLLLFASSALCLCAQAKELTFWDGDKKIEPNAEITYGGYELTDMGGGFSELKYAPDLYISSDLFTSTLNVTVTCLSGHNLQICCGGQCIAATPDKPGEKTNLKVQSNQKLPLDFDYVQFPYTGGEMPVVKAKIEAQDGKNEATHIAFTITMDPKTGAVKSVETVQPVSVANGRLEYSLPGNGTIELFAITGRSVLKANVHGSGTVDTSDLARGVYVYTLTTASGNRSGKFIVK